MKPFTVHSRILMLAEKQLQDFPCQFEHLSAELASGPAGTPQTAAMLLIAGHMELAYANHTGQWTKIDSHLRELIDTWSINQPERLDVTRGEETQEQRQKRRYDLCVNLCDKTQQDMPHDTYGHLPRGINNLAQSENISTPAFSKDVKAYMARNR